MTSELPLPLSEHIEVAVLGAMLLEPSALVRGIDSLRLVDFALDSHRRIFAAIQHLHKANLGIDSITLQDELARRRELDAVGGASYIAFLTEGIPRNFSIDSYILILREKAQLRGAMMLANRIQSEASDEQEGAQHLIERTIAEFRDLADNSGSNDLQQVGAYMDSQGEPERMFDLLATPNGIRFGFSQWDDMTGGAQPAELHVLAARPSMGKTAWMCNVADHTSVRDGKRVAVFSLEQPRDQIIRRMLSSSARIDARDIRRGSLRSQDRTLLLERRAMLCASALYIDDEAGMTVSRIKAKSRRLKSTLGLDLIVIDQLNHLDWSDVWQRGMQDHAAIGRQAKACKLMAQELQVPVVLLCQLNRDSAKRTDPTPKLADLAESGKIEQHADVITFLHRPEYYDKSDESLKGKGQMIVAKNREGGTGTCDCTYQARILRWEDDMAPAAVQEDLYTRGYPY